MVSSLLCVCVCVCVLLGDDKWEGLMLDWVCPMLGSWGVKRREGRGEEEGGCSHLAGARMEIEFIGLYGDT